MCETRLLLHFLNEKTDFRFGKFLPELKKSMRQFYCFLSFFLTFLKIVKNWENSIKIGFRFQEKFCKKLFLSSNLNQFFLQFLRFFFQIIEMSNPFFLFVYGHEIHIDVDRAFFRLIRI